MGGIGSANRQDERRQQPIGKFCYGNNDNTTIDASQLSRKWGCALRKTFGISRVKGDRLLALQKLGTSTATLEKISLGGFAQLPTLRAIHFPVIIGELSGALQWNQIMLKLHSISVLLKIFLPIALMTCWSEPASCQQPLVVFLVRHAEKVDASGNAKLSTAGNGRAAALASTLRDAGIEYVHSTDFIRTRKTASPVATKRGLKIDLYEAGDLPALVGKLRSHGGRHLVVGHSNTTPKLVELLGGEPGSKIQEKEYDRLYIVTIGKDGVAGTVLLRFGDAVVEEPGE